MTGHCGQQTPTAQQKLALFRQCFSGLSHAYGTYDPRSGRIFQIKQPVTAEVFLRHLRGQQPYGVYLLTGDRTRAMVIDFDVPDISGPLDFIRHSRHSRLRTYLERSKSIDSWHVWMFFDPCTGVNAAKARLVARHLLEEIDRSETEVFPKQDSLRNKAAYGNFVFAPLNGALVPEGRTVFVPPENPAQPFTNQWEVLRKIERVDESTLDDIVERNSLESPQAHSCGTASSTSDQSRSYGLPPCAHKMLSDGVTANQRVACFRLAAHLKRAGLPFASAIVVLNDWATRIRPADGKGVIRDNEIVSQAACAYEKESRACGCEDEAVTPYCDPGCPVRRGPTIVSLKSPIRGREETMTNRQSQRPDKVFRAGKIRAAIWRNESQADDGRTIVQHSVRIEKSFKDKKTGGWRTSDYFFADELPRLRLLADRAFEFITLREHDDTASAGPDENR